MTRCLFASDLHGHSDRYRRLFRAVAEETPDAVLLGGDLLPGQATPALGLAGGFIEGFILEELSVLRSTLGNRYPRVLVILGNDDPRSSVPSLEEGERRGLLEHVHHRRIELREYQVYGYACVPPTPFLLKDWERYDVSRHLEPGCVSPEEGVRTVPVAASEIRFGTIHRDLQTLVGEDDLERSVMLFHVPPYRTSLDRADLDSVRIDHVPADVHIGSIAVRRLIEERQPLLTLHGHVHESSRLTGAWSDRIGRTIMLSAAHDGPELALVRVDLDDPASATRELL